MTHCSFMQIQNYLKCLNLNCTFLNVLYSYRGLKSLFLPLNSNYRNSKWNILQNVKQLFLKLMLHHVFEFRNFTHTHTQHTNICTHIVTGNFGAIFQKDLLCILHILPSKPIVTVSFTKTELGDVIFFLFYLNLKAKATFLILRIIS